MVDEHVKEEVRQRLDIVTVVGRYVKLQKAGHYYKGLCPFHNDKKSPSFTVTPDKNIFYCFGCGKGGDVFSFISEIEGVAFPEALAMLAQEAGVELRTPSQATSPQRTSGNKGAISKKQLYAVNALAASFYYAQVTRNEDVIAFFKSRGIDAHMVREFKLGYAPAGWRGFLEYATKHKRVPPGVVHAAGLVIKKQDNARMYDRFRDRIIFPLYDIAGRVVGFAGRARDNETEPKYLNSPESPVYRKSRLLYGIHTLRDALQQEETVYVVEGYMDYLMLYQHGIRNCVATCGTALTPAHVALLRRFASRIIFVFDGDDAGRKAAERAVRICIPEGVASRVLLLPDGEDPDSIVQKWGREGFVRTAQQDALDAVDFVIAEALRRTDTDTPMGKLACVDELRTVVHDVADTLLRSDIITRCAEAIGVEEKHVYARLTAQQTSSRHSDDTSQQGNTQPDYRRYLSTIEGHFFRLVVNDTRLLEEALSRISATIFLNRFSSELFSIILYAYRNNALDHVTEYTSNQHIKNVCAMLLSQPPLQGDTQQELTHTMQRLENKYIKHKLYTIRTRLKKETDIDQKNELLRENVELTRWLQENTRHYHDTENE